MSGRAYARLNDYRLDGTLNIGPDGLTFDVDVTEPLYFFDGSRLTLFNDAGDLLYAGPVAQGTVAQPGERLTFTVQAFRDVPPPEPDFDPKRWRLVCAVCDAALDSFEKVALHECAEGG